MMENNAEIEGSEQRAAARDRADAPERALRPGKVLGSIRAPMWDEDATGRFQRPFRETTDAPDVVVFEHQGAWRAVARKCPHFLSCPDRQLDLADHGKIVGDEIHCQHAGHLWSCATGLSTSELFDDAPMMMAPVTVDSDGIASIAGASPTLDKEAP
jgi:nitrite reductase/ring-hydroxylating ferredoxin subunit